MIYINFNNAIYRGRQNSAKAFDKNNLFINLTLMDAIDRFIVS